MAVQVTKMNRVHKGASIAEEGNKRMEAVVSHNHSHSEAKIKREK